MNTKELAKLTGISVRTLHHYDNIGLLRPSRNDNNGFRDYSDQDLDQLQQILFFKQCGFSLSKIQSLLQSPTFDRHQAFELQKKYLLHEKKRIDKMLETLNKSIKSIKGEYNMTQNEKFEGFDLNHNPYEEEARQLWGDEVVDKSNSYIKSLPDEEKNAIAKGMDDLFIGLAKVSKESPASETAQNAIDKMYQHFNQNFGYQYTLEAFAGLGQMYITDSRFTKNIDKYGEGLSQFLADAMGIYAERKKK